MTKAVLPQMRSRRSGVIVNVSSAVTLRLLPALSVYSASKAAFNAFSESLALDAALFGVRAILVLTGSAPTTEFGKNAVARTGMKIQSRTKPTSTTTCRSCVPTMKLQRQMGLQKLSGGQ